MFLPSYNVYEVILMKIIKETLVYNSEAAFRDIYEMHEILDILKAYLWY